MEIIDSNSREDGINQPEVKNPEQSNERARSMSLPDQKKELAVQFGAYIKSGAHSPDDTTLTNESREWLAAKTFLAENDELQELRKETLGLVQQAQKPALAIPLVRMEGSFISVDDITPEQIEKLSQAEKRNFLAKGYLRSQAQPFLQRILERFPKLHFLRSIFKDRITAASADSFAEKDDERVTSARQQAAVKLQKIEQRIRELEKPHQSTIHRIEAVQQQRQVAQEVVESMARKIEERTELVQSFQELLSRPAAPGAHIDDSSRLLTFQPEELPAVEGDGGSTRAAYTGQLLDTHLAQRVGEIPGAREVTILSHRHGRDTGSRATDGTSGPEHLVNTNYAVEKIVFENGDIIQNLYLIPPFAKSGITSEFISEPLPCKIKIVTNHVGQLIEVVHYPGKGDEVRIGTKAKDREE